MILNEFVYLNHEELYNVNYNIEEKLKKYCKSKCSKETGFINKFIEIKSINKSFFNPTGEKMIFHVSFLVENYIPEKDDIIEAKVENILPDGIILSYPINNPKMSIMTNYRNDLEIGYIVSVKLKEIKYEKSSILCIGNLI